MEGENIREKCRQDGPSCDILERRNADHDEKLDDDPKQTRGGAKHNPHHFGNGVDVHLAKVARGKKAH